MILITGATGTVGRRLVATLTSQGTPVRALVRDEARARRVLGGAVELVRGDCADRASLRRAMSGARRVFVLSPLSPQLAALEKAVVAAAVNAGVDHVVKLSTAGVLRDPRAGGPREPRQYRLHRDSERFVESAGIAYTHLRPGPFFQNLLGFAQTIAATDTFYGAWGDGPMPYVDAGDVAAVAARVLIDTGHEGRAYTLTGPQALTHTDIADRLSRCLGRRIRYADGPVEAAGAAMRARGLPEWLAGAVAEVMHHARTAEPIGPTSDVELVTGRPPTPLQTFLTENAAAFGPSIAATA